MVFIGTQAILAYNKDMAVDHQEVDLLDWRNLGPTTPGLLKVRTKQDCAIRDLEVTMDEMDTKEFVGIMPGEEIHEVLDVFLLNNRLLGVVLEIVVSTKMLDLVARGTKWCLVISGFS